MKIEKIKPIPKYIQKLIVKMDKNDYKGFQGLPRFYSYLTKNDSELVNVTVAVKKYQGKLYLKQCVVHGIHSDKCFLKDILFSTLSGYKVGWYAEGIARYPKWYESEDWGWQSDKYFNICAPIVNLDYLHKFPEYKYSAFEIANTTRILEYLRLYERYPHLEYLVKAGFRPLMFSKQILKRLEKDKNFSRFLLQNRTEILTFGYNVNVILKAYTSKRPLGLVDNELWTVKQLITDYSYKSIKGKFKDKDLVKLAFYIDKNNISISSYADYYNACKQLGVDMTLPKNAFPHDFNRWHDIRIDEYATLKAKQDTIERRELYDKFMAIAQKYTTLQHNKRSNYICIIATSPADLVKEGNALHHCVGKMNYEQKFIREDSLIFFIREKSNPDVPFVTLEYCPKTHKILQFHGDNNSKPNDKTLQYINKTWLPYANKQLKQLAA